MLKSDMKAYNMSFFRLIKGYLTSHTFCLIRLYRIGNWLYKHNVKIMPELIKKGCYENIHVRYLRMQP